MSAGRRHLGWLVPVVLVAAAVVALALHPGADLEPEVRRFLASIEAGTPGSLDANTGLFPLWDPAELHAVAGYLRQALGPLREIESLGPTERVDRPGMPRRQVRARLRFARVTQPVEATFEFIRMDSGWTVSDFEILPPPGTTSGARRERAGQEAERLAGLATRLAFQDLHMSLLRRTRRATPLDDFTQRLQPSFEGLPLVEQLVLVSTEPRGAGVRTVLRATYQDGAVRTLELELQPEDGRWRLASIEVRAP